VFPLLSLGGCSSAPSCTDTFTACGGDLTGTWVFDAECNAAALTAMACPGATTTVSPNISGTYTFNADKTFSTSLSIAESGMTTLPASCLAGSTSCSELDLHQTSDGTTIDETCTGNAAQSCTCSISQTGTLTETGTYLTAGNNLTQSSGGSAGNPTPYCVNGSQLQISISITGGISNAYLLFNKQ
jgi:hypothetical protein